MSPSESCIRRNIQERHGQAQRAQSREAEEQQREPLAVMKTRAPTGRAAADDKQRPGSPRSSRGRRRPGRAVIQPSGPHRARETGDRPPRHLPSGVRDQVHTPPQATKPRHQGPTGHPGYNLAQPTERVRGRGRAGGSLGRTVERSQAAGPARQPASRMQREGTVRPPSAEFGRRRG